jgi:hypothetical protein
MEMEKFAEEVFSYFVGSRLGSLFIDLDGLENSSMLESCLADRNNCTDKGNHEKL